MTDATNDHWLVWGDPDWITGCHCGFRADTAADVGCGDSVVKHLLAVGWVEGYVKGTRGDIWDSPEGKNPYA